MKRTLSYDDVLLEPQYSNIETRSSIDISNVLGEHELSLPVISSPMDTVTDADMASAVAHAGGIGIIHRYNTPMEQAEAVQRVKDGGWQVVGAAIGIGITHLHRAKVLAAAGAEVLCLDVAHGHHVLMERMLKSVKDEIGDSVHIMAGNVATRQAYEDLAKWGADSIRVGIGGGSICSTRLQTGHGVPTLQSVLDCCDVAKEYGVSLIADGGIKSSGDIVKSFAAGADFVMVGSLLAGTDESPGKTLSIGGKMYKTYRGMASAEAQLDWRGRASSLEGISTMIPYKGSVTSILQQLDNGIRSGFSYTGAHNFSEFREKAKFIEQTFAGQRESATHILERSS